MPAARGKSERDKKVNFSHLARKRSHFSCWENRLRARGTYAAKIRMKDAPLRDRNFTRFRSRRRRNDPFGFRGSVLPPKFFHVKQQEHAGHVQVRTDPFQEPTEVAENLNRSLPEILRIPR